MHRLLILILLAILTTSCGSTPSPAAVTDATTSAPAVATAPDPPTGANSDNSAPEQNKGVSHGAATSPQGPLYQVLEVVDGDTIAIEIEGRSETLRLIGLDTPETKDPRKPVQCFGREASNRAKELLEGKKVRIAEDPTQDTRDKYGRMLVYVWRADGLFYNLQMIKDGYAHEYTYQVPHQYQRQFKAAEAEAREAGRGFWDSSTCGGDTKQAADEGSETKRKPTPTPAPKKRVDVPPGNCDPNYKGACIPPYSQGDVDCGEIEARNIRIVGSDPHKLDGSRKNGVACEG